jgi:NTE family protein
LKNRLDHELAGTIEELGRRFAAVATEIGTGHEIWLTKGPIVPAVRASYALPGIFEPVRVGGRWLFDGALVNPVPVSVCRALGAEMVIGVNLVGDNAFRGTIIADHASLEETLEDMGAAVAAAPQKSGMLLSGVRNLRRHFGRREDGAPGIAGVMMDAFNITQDRIARSRLAGDPPDVIVNTRLNAFGLFEFHRSDELIAMGRESVRRAMPDIRDYIAHTPAPVGTPAQGL